jgi:TPR repeat protein
MLSSRPLLASLSLLCLAACASAPSVPVAPPAPVSASVPPCSGWRACLAVCSSGGARACTLSAEGLRYGSGTARDVPRAERLYRQACEARDGLGCAGLGWVSQGAEAEEAFRRAARHHGNLEAALVGGRVDVALLDDGDAGGRAGHERRGHAGQREPSPERSHEAQTADGGNGDGHLTPL